MSNPYLAHLNTDPSKSYLNKRSVKIKRPKTPMPVALQRNPSESIHGNYQNYYQYRNTCKDTRLSLLDPEIFKGKDVLDIGCNSGLISIELSRIHNCKSILGVDIDPNLIRKSRTNLNYFNSLDFNNLINFFPLSCQEQFGQIKRKTNVEFRVSDWVHESLEENFDIIIALSITKWIHLNNGDGGIRYFFNKVFKSLNHGGFFILEPQSFTGYRKRAGMTLKMKRNFDSIEFYPDDFINFLVKKVGFKIVNTFDVPHEQKGFNRTLYVFQKGVVASDK